jgi:hypothetical protein
MDSIDWQQTRNIIAYPHGWQYPVITEQHAYECVCSKLPDNSKVTYVGFPWATLIDLLETKQEEKAQAYLRILEKMPRVNAGSRITVAQHIYVKRYPEIFEKAGITDLFWVHATTDLPCLGAMQIHPFPHFPVRCLDIPHLAGQPGKPLKERKYLYSFVGAYAPKFYLTKARHWIAKLPPTIDSCILSRNEWYYQSIVFDKQLFGKAIGPQKQCQLDDDAAVYRYILEETVFSLCPSGSGPNSIRLWESLGFGSIPVILADSLKLPGGMHEWRDAAIFIPENKKSIKLLPARLRELASQQDVLDGYQRAVGRLWEKYGYKSFITDLLEFCRQIT